MYPLVSGEDILVVGCLAGEILEGVAELLGSAISGLFNKAKRLHALHACKGPSRHAAAFTCQDRGYITNRKKKKKLLDILHARQQPSLDSQHRYITLSNSYSNHAI